MRACMRARTPRSTGCAGMRGWGSAANGPMDHSLGGSGSGSAHAEPRQRHVHAVLAPRVPSAPLRVESRRVESRRVESRRVESHRVESRRVESHRVPPRPPAESSTDRRAALAYTRPLWPLWPSRQYLLCAGWLVVRPVRQTKHRHKLAQVLHGTVVAVSEQSCTYVLCWHR